MERWKKLSSTTVFSHKWIRVQQHTVQLPNGKILNDYFIVPSSDVAMVVPITKDGKYILTKQYRYALDDFVIEFPAGKVNEKEDPEQAALREMREETGYTASSAIKIATLTNSPNRNGAKVHVFLARNAKKTHGTFFDETESIETISLTWQELKNMIRNGDIYISASVAAAYLSREMPSSCNA